MRSGWAGPTGERRTRAALGLSPSWLRFCDAIIVLSPPLFFFFSFRGVIELTSSGPSFSPLPAQPTRPGAGGLCYPTLTQCNTGTNLCDNNHPCVYDYSTCSTGPVRANAD